MELAVEIVAYGIQFFLQMVFLVLALWLMVALQKLQYNFLGLLGTAALASALCLIPYFGRILAGPAVLLCLLKVTHETWSDVVFTAAISWVLVWAMNFLLVSWLISGGGLMARFHPHSPGRPQTTVADNSDDDEPADAATNHVAASGKTTGTNTVKTIGATKPKVAAPKAPDEAVARVSPRAAELARTLTLKSVTNNGKNSMAMISTGAKNYTLFLNETASVQLPDGASVNVQCVSVDDNSAVLLVDGARVPLSLQ